MLVAIQVLRQHDFWFFRPPIPPRQQKSLKRLPFLKGRPFEKCIVNMVPDHPYPSLADVILEWPLISLIIAREAVFSISFLD